MNKKPKRDREWPILKNKMAGQGLIHKVEQLNLNDRGAYVLSLKEITWHAFVEQFSFVYNLLSDQSFGLPSDQHQICPGKDQGVDIQCHYHRLL